MALKIDEKKTCYMYVSQRKYEKIYEKDFFDSNKLDVCWENGVYTYNMEEHSDKVFITPDRYVTVQSAKSMLALPEVPAYRLEIEIVKNDARYWKENIVKPLRIDRPHEVDEPGGGIEYYAIGQISFKFKEYKLQDTNLKSLLYLDRINQFVSNPDLYELSPFCKDNFEELNKSLSVAINDGTANYKKGFENSKKKYTLEEEAPYSDKWLLESYFFFLYYMDYLNTKKLVNYATGFTAEKFNWKGFKELGESFFTGSKKLKEYGRLS